jgi:formate-dependent nitrite reductase membrane component NrfD
VNPAPSSTWFSAPPDWGWYVAAYLFVGGVAGGCYFLASLIDLLGTREDRPLARIGYYVAFPCVLAGGLLLTLDLTRPLRFWHMLIESNTYRPMLKYWSPMSLGSWALLVFGFFSFLAFLGALAEDGRLSRPVLRKLRPPSILGVALAALGGLAGLYVAGYTGVLLAVTNRPIWSDSNLLGMLFVVSAASSSAALITFLAHRYGWTMPAVTNLRRMEGWTIALELVVIVALVVSLGPVARAWMNVWGGLLVLVVVLGTVVPLVLTGGARRVRHANVPIAAALVVLGGLLLRLVIVFSSEAV